MAGTPKLKAPAAGRKAGNPGPTHLWIALAHSYRALSARVEQSVADTGLNLTDFMLLEALLHKGPLTITEIQGSILLATGSMTAAVDRVEAKGLIVRKQVKADRRARCLELTPAGRTLIEAAFQQHSADLRQWFSVLSATEQACAYKGLRKLSQHVASLPAKQTPG